MERNATAYLVLDEYGQQAEHAQARERAEQDSAGHGEVDLGLEREQRQHQRAHRSNDHRQHHLLRIREQRGEEGGGREREARYQRPKWKRPPLSICADRAPLSEQSILRREKQGT